MVYNDDDVIWCEDQNKYNADNYRHSFHKEGHFRNYMYNEERRDCNNAAEKYHTIYQPTQFLYYNVTLVILSHDNV